MVDFRPLLFLNALALMLLVTAGFASVRDPTPTPIVETVAETAIKPEATPEQPAVRTEPFSMPQLPEEPLQVASAEPLAAMADYTAAAQKPAPEEAPAPTTGALILRSNVVGDHVEINGKAYGQTRLDLELAPGKYDITISKAGFKPWQQTVALGAGNELTLVGKLEAYTTVNYQNGSWVGGVKTGDGTYEDSDGLRYEGHFIDGAFHGAGAAWYPDGSRYEGDWEDGKRTGEGVWREADGSNYTGQFKENAFHGQGTLTLTNGDILTGQWSQGRLNGHGSQATAEGMLYVGNFRNSDFHGRGTLTYPDGRHYEGDFSNGTFHGSGSEVFANGKKYEGEYIEGKFHGNGLLSNPNGSSIEATFRHGEPYGQVRLTTAAGELFTARTSEPGVCYRDKSYRATQCPKLEGW
ncbi:MORN repeat-containing protein [Marinobacter sp.]|uniref:MORN repeat-containing protein n=1 Tax=Marinobacter sp. TaxID=50741 RepID=UPI001B51C13B|nr:PEGA domain-containing protein [Marinobacter sp.]MBQ0831529.1 PEGA domain-containing protein [Marinobacter sp.]